MDQSRPRPAPTATQWGLLAGAALLFGLAIPSRAASPTASCAPGAFGIFDFQVDDVFQYTWVAPAMVDQRMGRKVTIRKVRVASRQESGTMRAYRLAVLTRETLETGDFISPPTFGSSIEDLAVMDTAGNPFAGCLRDIVPMPTSWGTQSMLWTRVEFRDNDKTLWPLAKEGLRIKAYGRELGYARGDSITPVMDFRHTEAYAEGLGLVFASQAGMLGGSGQSKTLTGYKKGTVTVGTVEPDYHFWAGAALRPRSERINRIKGPASRFGFAWKAGRVDLRGRASGSIP